MRWCPTLRQSLLARIERRDAQVRSVYKVVETNRLGLTLLSAGDNNPRKAVR